MLSSMKLGMVFTEPQANKWVWQVWEPYLDNPITNWWLDLCMDIALRAYYWPMTAATEMDQWRSLLSGSNLCKPH